MRSSDVVKQKTASGMRDLSSRAYILKLFAFEFIGHVETRGYAPPPALYQLAYQRVLRILTGNAILHYSLGRKRRSALKYFTEGRQQLACLANPGLTHHDGSTLVSFPSRHAKSKGIFRIQMGPCSVIRQYPRRSFLVIVRPMEHLEIFRKYEQTSPNFKLIRTNPGPSIVFS